MKRFGSYLYISFLAVLALFGLYIAATGGGAFWDLVVPPRTDYTDMLKRLKGASTSVNEEHRKKYYTPILGLVAFVFPSQPRKDPARPAAVTERLQEMLDAYNAGELKRAIKAARRVLDLEPANVDALLCLVIESAWLKEHAGLLPEFLARAEASPPSAEYHAALGRLYGELGKPDKALSHLEAARELNPSLPCLHNHLGVHWSIFAPTLDLGRTLDEYNLERATSRHPAAFHSLDYWYRTKFEDYEAAVKVWEDFQRDYKLIGMNHSAYARALAAAGRHAEVRAQVAAEIAEPSQNPPATYNDAGTVYLFERMWDDALAHYKAGIDKYGAFVGGDLGNYLFGNYAKALFETGRYDEVIAPATTSIRHEENSRAYYHRGLVHLIQGDTAGADRDFARSIALEKERDLDFANAQYFRWLIKKNPGKRFTREEVLKVHRWFPPATRADRLAHSGTGYLLWGVYGEAQKKFDAALALDPKNGFAHAGIVRMHLFKKDVAGARAAGAKALALGVAHPFLYKELGHIDHFYDKDYARAESWYRKAIELLPQMEPLNNSMARLLDVTGRDVEALDYWDRTGGSAERSRDVLGPNKRPASAAMALLCLLLMYMHIRRRNAAPAPEAAAPAPKPTQKDVPEEPPVILSTSREAATRRSFNRGFVWGWGVHTLLFVGPFPILFVVSRLPFIPHPIPDLLSLVIGIFTMFESFLMLPLALFALQGGPGAGLINPYTGTTTYIAYAIAYLAAGCVWGAIFGIWHHVKSAQEALPPAERHGVGGLLLRIPVPLRITLFIVCMLLLAVPPMVYFKVRQDAAIRRFDEREAKVAAGVPPADAPSGAKAQKFPREHAQVKLGIPYKWFATWVEQRERAADLAGCAVTAGEAAADRKCCVINDIIDTITVCFHKSPGAGEIDGTLYFIEAAMGGAGMMRRPGRPAPEMTPEMTSEMLASSRRMMEGTLTRWEARHGKGRVAECSQYKEAAWDDGATIFKWKWKKDPDLPMLKMHTILIDKPAEGKAPSEKCEKDGPFNP